MQNTLQEILVKEMFLVSKIGGGGLQSAYINGSTPV